MQNNDSSYNHQRYNYLMASEQNCELVSEKTECFSLKWYTHILCLVAFLQSVPKDIFTTYCFFPINLS